MKTNEGKPPRVGTNQNENLEHGRLLAPLVITVGREELIGNETGRDLNDSKLLRTLREGVGPPISARVIRAPVIQKQSSSPSSRVVYLSTEQKRNTQFK